MPSLTRARGSREVACARRRKGGATSSVGRGNVVDVLKAIPMRTRGAEALSAEAQGISLTSEIASTNLRAMLKLRLDHLATPAGVHPATLRRWAASGLVRAENGGVGRGNGYVLKDREAAIEALGLGMLSAAGVPTPQLKQIVHKFRAQGSSNTRFLMLGARGRALLTDDLDVDSPRDLCEQFVLPLFLDLRALRPELERLVDGLLAEGEGA
jgi:hypothetical protein